MISLICFILTLAGSINWFCIGVLQYDFVAGIFGSQANIFSRIIYALIGLSSIWLVYAAIRGKGRIKIDGKQSTDKQLLSTKKSMASAETSNEYDPNRFSGFNNHPYSDSLSHHNDTNQKPYDHNGHYPPDHRN